MIVARRTTTTSNPRDRVVNMIYGGPAQLENRRKAKVTMRQLVYATIPGTPEYLRWSEIPITFSRQDHSGMVPKSGRYPLVISPTIRNVGLGKMLVDGGSGPNILFASTLKEIKLTSLDLKPIDKPFFSIVPRDPSVPLGEITLPVMFGTPNNYRTEHIRFIVADFKMAYHGILGRPALAKFMVVPHYTYMIMKMPAPNGVITVKGDTLTAYACEKENLQIVATLDLSRRREEVLAAAKELDLEELEILIKKPAMEAIKRDKQETKKVSLGLEDLSKTVTIGANMDPK